MDAVEIILYVIIMIIWVIVQNARKKKLKQQQQARQEAESEDFQTDRGPQRERPNQRSLIDEIIRELREENEKEDEAFEIEPEPYQQRENIPQIPKETVKPVRNYDKELKELKSKAKSRDHERFEHYKIPKKPTVSEEEEENEYASLLFEDPDSPRKAIILSEILNRKHF